MDMSWKTLIPASSFLLKIPASAKVDREEDSLQLYLRNPTLNCHVYRADDKNPRIGFEIFFVLSVSDILFETE